MKNFLKKGEVTTLAAVVAAVLILSAGAALIIQTPEINFEGITGAATYTISDCKNTSWATGSHTYELNTNVTASAGDSCFYNMPSYTVIDCKGYTITGDFTTNKYGVDIDTKDSVEVRNCHIKNFDSGVNVYYSSDCTIINSTIENNTDDGVYLNQGSGYHSIINNTIFNNSNGIKTSYIDHLTIQNNTLYDNSQNDISIDCEKYTGLTIINNTGSGGRHILFVSSDYVDIEDKDLSELILCDFNYAMVRNVTVHGSDTLNNNGIYLSRTTNCNFTDINSSGNYRGLDVQAYSHSNSVYDNLFDSNLIGIRDYPSSNNYYNNTITNNIEAGIYSSANVDYYYNNITNNTVGIFLYSGTSTIHSNNIQQNDIGLKYHSSSGITCYNNFFNNSINVLNDTAPSTYHKWNTTLNCTVGPNIIGGDCIGGNYWNDYDGVDNNADGIGDTKIPYNASEAIGSGSGDFLPLASPSGTEISSCQDLSASGKYYLSSSLPKVSGQDCITFSADDIILDCYGNIINGPESYDSIYIGSNRDNITIKNCVIFNSTYGIHINNGGNENYVNSPSNILIDNCTINLTYTGISASYVENLTISNNLLYNATYYGMGISTIGANIINNTLITFDSGSSQKGIAVGQKNNYIINNTIIGFTSDGIYLKSNDSIVSNNSLIGNQNGIKVLASSTTDVSNVSILYNKVINSTYHGIDLSGYQPTSKIVKDFVVAHNIIINSSSTGIYLNSYNLNHLIYNNYLNNTNNAYSGILTDWNTTYNCASGFNIIGGDCIGGNFYATPSGNGHSEICTDDNADGICDSSYSIPGSSSVDYLPLASPSAGAPGETTVDLGDAPDSTNSWNNVTMTAYTGVNASFPTVHINGSPPYGPCHENYFAVLGTEISLENESDIGPDQDGVTNINATADIPDRDSINYPPAGFGMDDGLAAVPIDLTHSNLTINNCSTTSIPINLSITGGPYSIDWNATLNIWIDYNRDGDWGNYTTNSADNVTCSFPGDTSEWIVQNYVAAQLFAAGFGPGNITVNPTFKGYIPSGSKDVWMRVQLTEVPVTYQDGSGPSTCYEDGETEDYYVYLNKSEEIVETGCCVEPGPYICTEVTAVICPSENFYAGQDCSEISSCQFYPSGCCNDTCTDANYMAECPDNFEIGPCTSQPECTPGCCVCDDDPLEPSDNLCYYPLTVAECVEQCSLLSGYIMVLHDTSTGSNTECQSLCPTSGTSASEFSTYYGSTNFSAVPDITDVTNLTLATAHGKIHFSLSHSVDASGEDYDSYVEIGDNFISVDTAELDPTFNSSANLTINNVVCPVSIYYGAGVFASSSSIVNQGNICDEYSDPSCKNINCVGNTLTFTVSHFTGFASGPYSNLTIWDETDLGMLYGDQTRYENEQVKFFANYTNSTGTIEGAACVINFTDSSSSMVWNSTTNLYEYNRSFSSQGTYDWNVTCNKTGFGTLTANDTVMINHLVSCGSTITLDTTLTSNLNCTGDGIIIGANNITLDCDGYTIIRNDTPSGGEEGVYINGFDNVTVKNCRISNFWSGIYAINSPDYLNLTNNTIEIYNYAGIMIVDSENSAIFENKLKGKGITLSNSNYTLVSDNIMYNCSSGITVSSQSSNNNITNNIVNKSTGNGAGSSSGYHNNYINNSIINSVGTGFTLSNADNNFIFNNYLANNSQGFSISSSSNNVFQNNNITNHSNRGMYLSGSNNNTFTNNKFRYNKNDGIHITSSSKNNTFINNDIEYHDWNGIYLASSATNNNFTDTRSCFNNQTGGAYYDLNDLDSNNFKETTCDFSSPSGLCNYSCSGLPPGCDYGLDSCKTSGWVSGKTYCLNQSIVDSNTCMQITVDDVVLDCRGYSIKGSHTNYGLNIQGNIDNATIQNCIISDYQYGIRLYNSNLVNAPTNIVIDNCTLNSSSSDGIYAYYIINLTVANSHIIDNPKGIEYYYGDGSYIFNNTIQNCNNDGLFLYNIPNSIVINNSIINLSTSVSRAVFIRGNNSLVSNNTLIKNRYGIEVSTHTSGDILNVTISGNLIANSSYYGINLYGWDSSNEVKNCNIFNNKIINSGTYGISANTYSSYNKIYNNYLNNTVNGYSNAFNYWNTSKTLETNIVGGDYIGGNFWVTPSGSGHSQLCTDDGTGICTVSYSVPGGNTDYLPLAIPLPKCPAEMSGSNTTADPCLITNCTQLQAMNQSLSNHYALANDIDCSDTINWNSGAGFDPVGNNTDQFTGNLDGDGYSISNLYINRSDEYYVGLIGYSNNSNLKNINFNNVNVSGFMEIGSLVGYSFKTNITDCSAKGSLFCEYSRCGGLIGLLFINSTLRNSSANVNLTTSDSGNWMGGLAGYIYESSVIGSNSIIHTVNSKWANVGGLIGFSYTGNVNNCFSYGKINVSDGSSIGGLVGHTLSNSLINNSYSNVDVETNVSWVGGLVGSIGSGSKIQNSYSTGNCSGDNYVGGLLGDLPSSTDSVTNSYSTSNVDATGNPTGGLVGRNYGTITNSYSTGRVIATETPKGGLVGQQTSSGDILNSFWNNLTTENPPVCVGSDSGSTTCTAIQDNESYFFDINEPPMTSWSFPPWDDICNELGYPSLEWEGLTDASECLGYTPPPPIEIDSCRELNKSGKTYLLNTSLTGISGTCFNITNNSIILDCQGYNLIGDETGNGVNVVSQENITIQNCMIKNFSSGIYAEDISQNLLVFNNTLYKNKYYGINTDNINLSIIDSNNATSTNQYSGILVGYTTDCYNNTIINNIANENNRGIRIMNGFNHNITNNSASNNNYEGIDLGCEDCMVKNNSAFNNSKGIGLLSASNNLIDSNNLLYNTLGMTFQYSNSNTIVNNIIKDSKSKGIEISYEIPSRYNNITKNRILNSTNYGIHITISCTNCKNNTIYDNLLNNTNNVYSSVSGNFWNTTYSCGSGTNIIGGDCLGGNFYANLSSGAGHSEICADGDSDGICDSSYSIPGSSDVDYLPLTIEVSGAPSVCPAEMSGSNTTADPCLITNCTQLQAMNQSLSNHYALANDIDCSDTVNWNSGDGFNPIGNFSVKFTGTFDGRNYTITGLFINRPSTNYVGLFGYTNTANISNVGFEEVNITGSTYVGAIAGLLTNGSATHSYSTGSISGTGNSIGGLLGRADESAIVDNCYSTCDVYNDSSTFKGGLVGIVFAAFVNNSYATGNVLGSDKVGGLAGASQGTTTIENSFSTGNVSSSCTTYCGGFVGWFLSGTFNNNYWNNHSGNPDKCYYAGESGCTAIQDDYSYFYDIDKPPMSSWSFPPWDDICNESGYPSLEWEGLTDVSECKFDCTDNDGDGYNITGGLCGPIDCNDSNSSIYPGATEVCNGVDDDCDTLVDEDFVNETCQYVCINSGFNWSNNGLPNLNCCGNDHNEDSPYELAEASCFDSNDNDCDGLIDFNDIDCLASCIDSDEDTYSVSGGVCGDIDCNDSDNETWQNLTGYLDSDIDTYGTGILLTVCSGATLPTGYSSNSNDCDDSNNTIYPGAAENTEPLCTNSQDDDCDGKIDCADSLCTPLTICQPEDDDFDGDTTGFDTVPDITNVTNCTLEKEGYGKITWNNPVNAEAADFNNNIQIEYGFIAINTTSLHSSFNSSANITLYNVTCGYFIYYNPGFGFNLTEELINTGQLCNETTDPSCTNITCTDNNLTFTVNHFSGFGAGATCGDSICEIAECNSCSLDCNLTLCCGNGQCNPFVGENSNTCSADCPRGSSGGRILKECYQNITCTEWSACLPNGTQQRQCYDLNNCEQKYSEKTVNRVYYAQIPELTQECVYTSLVSCTDRIKNQDETDIDCGGSICPRCSNGKRCLTDRDCINNCDTAQGICFTPEPVIPPQVEIPAPLPEEPRALWPYFLILGIIIIIVIGVYTYENFDKMAFYERYMTRKHERLIDESLAKKEKKKALSLEKKKLMLERKRLQLERQKKEAVKELHRRLRKEYAHKLEFFIEKAIDKGYKKTEIKNALTAKGWPVNFVNKYVDAYFKEHHIWIKKMEKEMEKTEIYKKLKEEVDYINQLLRGKK